MKIFSIEHYENKIEELQKLADIVAYRAGYADGLAEVRKEMYEKFCRLFHVARVAEEEQDDELEEYMAVQILEYAARFNIINEGDVEAVTDEELMERLIKRINNANFESIYYWRKSTEILKRIDAAAKVVIYLQKAKIFKLRAAVAIGKMIFPHNSGR